MVDYKKEFKGKRVCIDFEEEAVEYENHFRDRGLKLDMAKVFEFMTWLFTGVMIILEGKVAKFNWHNGLDEAAINKGLNVLMEKFPDAKIS